MLNLLSYKDTISSAWGKVKEALQNSFSDSNDHSAQRKICTSKVQDIPIPSFKEASV
jgi:hypothetical protein